MSSNVGISVIIPLYNKAATVRRAIDSVLSQVNVDKEVIVVDDGSTDGSDQVISQYGSRVVFVTQRNAGPSAARNRGVAHSNYPVVAFLDADDEMLAGCLASHMACRAQRDDVQLTLANFKEVNEGRVEREEHLNRRVHNSQVDNDCVYTQEFTVGLIADVHISSICIERSLFRAVGGFDPTLRCWEISELMFRVALARPVTAIPRNAWVAIHKDLANSQFERTVGKSEYVRIFALKLMAQIERVPETARQDVLGKVASFMYLLWKQNAYEAFHEVAAIACPWLRRYGVAPRLCFAAKLPNGVLKLWRMWRP